MQIIKINTELNIYDKKNIFYANKRNFSQNVNEFPTDWILLVKQKLLGAPIIFNCCCT